MTAFIFRLEPFGSIGGKDYSINRLAVKIPSASNEDHL